LAQDRSTTKQVIQTESGHTIELDDTFPVEQIIVTHMSGSTLTMHRDGTISIDSSNDVITLDGNTSITGTLSVSDATTLQNTLAVSGAQTNASTIVASDTITDSGATLGTHTHTEQGDGNKTSTPD